MKRILKALESLRTERRTLGWRGLLRKHGWALVAVVVLYYLVRDTLLYIALPLAIAAGLFR